MMIIDQLVVQHQTLRNKTAVNPDSVDMNEILALSDQVRAASAHIEDAQQREQLQAILYHWNSYIHDKTGAYPATQLSPYTPASSHTASTPQGMTARTSLPLPTISWLGWAFAALLVVAGILFVIWPHLTAVSKEPLTPEQSTAMALTAVVASQTAVSQQATATRHAVVQTSEAVVLMFAPTITPTAEIISPTVSQPISYTVSPGDTLVGISQKHGTTIDDIRQLNNLTSDTIAIGQLLWLPAPIVQTEVTAVVVIATPALPEGQQLVQLVVRSQSSNLQSGPSPDFSPIYTLPRGTFAYVIGRNQANDWYLVQLEDGVTRGWLPVTDTGLLHPASPETLPIITP